MIATSTPRMRTAAVALVVSVWTVGCHESHAPAKLAVPVPAAQRVLSPVAAPVAPDSVDLMRHALFDALALKPGMKLAEVGFGGGWFVTNAARALAPGGFIYATDVDPEAVGALRTREPLGVGVSLRLCNGPRDTALDDLPAGQVDVVTMVDSLCFSGDVPREENLAYLRRLLRILRPGGRLVHHMDCRCDTTPEAVTALFTDAGFSQKVEFVDLPAAVGADPVCQTDADRRRERFAPVFRSPERP
jgi:precorrin-6B methylase 2